MRASLPLDRQCEAAGLPHPMREFRFHPSRKWKFDYSWPEFKLAVEVDGAIWTGGRHTRGAGYERDMEKLNEALCLGWVVLRVSTGMVKDGRALGYVERLLKDGRV